MFYSLLGVDTGAIITSNGGIFIGRPPLRSIRSWLR